LPKSVERLGRRRPEGQPRSLGQLVLSTTDTLSRFDQRRQFVWREFAEALEVGATGERPDADERDKAINFMRARRPAIVPFRPTVERAAILAWLRPSRCYSRIGTRYLSGKRSILGDVGRHGEDDLRY
jgi:hypothetical protein